MAEKEKKEKKQKINKSPSRREKVKKDKPEGGIISKSIIKEIIIMLLLCLAIILILGVLLYEYVPSNKIIPEEVAYTTPEDVKQEISKGEGVDDEQVIMTYSVDSTDLKNYERINTYVAGKPNPFSSYQETQSEQNTTNGTSTGSSSSTGTSGTSQGGSTTSGSTPTSGGTYIPDKGTK